MAEGAGFNFNHTNHPETAHQDEDSCARRTVHESPRISNWRIVWALIMTNGSKRLTKEAYQSVRNITESLQGVGDFSWKAERAVGNTSLLQSRSTSFLPHYSTLSKAYKPHLIRSLAPRGEDYSERAQGPTASMHTTPSPHARTENISVRIIPPSEYARADVSTPLVWSAMRSTSLSACRHQGSVLPPASSTYCVDLLPVVASRSWFYCPKSSMTIDEPDTAGVHTFFAEVGDTVQIRLLHHIEFNEALCRCFSNPFLSNPGNRLQGVVVHS